MAGIGSEPLTPETGESDVDKDPRVRYFNLKHSQFILMFFFMLIAWNLGYWGFSSIWVILLFFFLFTGDIYTRQLALRRKLDALLVKNELRAVEDVVGTLPSWVCIFILSFVYHFTITFHQFIGLLPRCRATRMAQ